MSFIPTIIQATSAALAMTPTIVSAIGTGVLLLEETIEALKPANGGTETIHQVMDTDQTIAHTVMRAKKIMEAGDLGPLSMGASVSETIIALQKALAELSELDRTAKADILVQDASDSFKSKDRARESGAQSITRPELLDGEVVAMASKLSRVIKPKETMARTTRNKVEHNKRRLEVKSIRRKKKSIAESKNERMLAPLSDWTRTQGMVHRFELPSTSTETTTGGTGDDNRAPVHGQFYPTPGGDYVVELTRSEAISKLAYMGSAFPRLRAVPGLSSLIPATTSGNATPFTEVPHLDVNKNVEYRDISVYSTSQTDQTSTIVASFNDGDTAVDQASGLPRVAHVSNGKKEMDSTLVVRVSAAIADIGFAGMLFSLFEVADTQLDGETSAAPLHILRSQAVVRRKGQIIGLNMSAGAVLTCDYEDSSLYYVLVRPFDTANTFTSFDDQFLDVTHHFSVKGKVNNLLPTRISRFANHKYENVDGSEPAWKFLGKSERGKGDIIIATTVQGIIADDLSSLARSIAVANAVFEDTGNVRSGLSKHHKILALGGDNLSAIVAGLFVAGYIDILGDDGKIADDIEEVLDATQWIYEDSAFAKYVIKPEDFITTIHHFLSVAYDTVDH